MKAHLAVGGIDNETLAERSRSPHLLTVSLTRGHDDEGSGSGENSENGSSTEKNGSGGHKGVIQHFVKRGPARSRWVIN